MRVYVFPADRFGCGHYRLIWAARELQRRGHDVVLRMPDERHELSAAIDKKTGELVDVVVPPDADVIVMQRISHRHLAAAIPVMRERYGIATVVDVDDDMMHIHPDNPAFTGMHPRLQGVARPDHSWTYTSEACHNATLVTTSTSALRHRYGHLDRNVVLVNRVPEWYLDVPHSDSPCLGWAGALHSHPNDVPVLGQSVARLVRELGLSFTVVGPDAPSVGRVLGLPTEPHSTGAVAMADWPHAVSALGIGLAPLADTRFNAGKCLDAQTRVVTRRGLIKIGEVTTDDYVWRNGWRRVLGVEHSEPCEGLCITTTQGRSISLTRTHRLASDGEWKNAVDIEVGDTLDYAEETWPQHDYQYVSWPAESRQASTRWARESDTFNDRSFWSATHGPQVRIDEVWGRLLGLFVGNGCVGSNMVSIAFDHQDQDLIDQTMNDFRSIGLRPMFRSDSRYDGKRYRGCGVVVSSTHLVRFLELVGVVERKDPINVRHGMRRVLRIPDILWRSPRSVMSAFMSGLWEADGSGDRGLSLCTKSAQLAWDVQRALLAFGIVGTRNAKQLSGPSQPRKYVGRWYWVVTLGRRTADVFMREIGFLSKRKCDRMLEVRKFVPGSHGSGKIIAYADTVSTIEVCTVRPVDIQVEGEVFAAVSFVSHNSWLKPLEYAAVGVPWVASPRAEYRALHALGVGALAEKPRDWYREIRRLVDDPIRRVDMSQAGRAVARELTVERGAHLWWEAWTRAYELEQSGPNAGRATGRRASVAVASPFVRSQPSSPLRRAQRDVRRPWTLGP